MYIIRQKRFQNIIKAIPRKVINTVRNAIIFPMFFQDIVPM